MLLPPHSLAKHLVRTDIPEVPDPAAGPASQALACEMAESLRTALARLPEQQGLCFSLRYLEDLSYEQIAQALGLSSNAVGVLIHRAKSKLKQLMTVTNASGDREVQHD